MGLHLKAKNVNLSAISYGKLGPTTLVSAGLTHLFMTMESAEYGVINHVGGIPATVVGTPIWGAGYMDTTGNDYLQFDVHPTGDRTIAIIFQPKTVHNPSALALPFSCFDTVGPKGEYFGQNSVGQVGFESFNLYAVPASPPYPRVAAAMDRFDMYAMVNKNAISTALYAPRTGNLATVVHGASLEFVSTLRYRSGYGPSGALSQRVCMFAYWNRALTTSELQQFYVDMQPYFGARAVAI